MTRTAIAAIRLSITLITLIGAAITSHPIVAIIVTLWFISTVKRDSKAVSNTAIKSRLERLREDKRKYPYKYRLNRGHDWID